MEEQTLKAIDEGSPEKIRELLEEAIRVANKILEDIGFPAVVNESIIQETIRRPINTDYCNGFIKFVNEYSEYTRDDNLNELMNRVNSQEHIKETLEFIHTVLSKAYEKCNAK